MHENSRVNCPDGVTESLQAVELVPFTALSFVDLKLDIFSDCVSAATHNDHHRTNEDT